MVSLPHTPAQIRDSAKYYPYFKECIGAFDGTHIPVVPPSAIAPRFRNSKGFCSSNVLAACNFKMEFVYVLSGWEGSAHDGRVLMDAVAHDFHISRGLYGYFTSLSFIIYLKQWILHVGKYYLGGAGYTLNSFPLTPYRGVRYHLKEFGDGQQKLQNMQELQHSSL
jgi:hypothetical protein